ncbi:glycosyltransferase family 39 protein, partial [Candidatus Parcubacteria bacterium]|nr:glycosyltransferase family 39 protein [Candidatus Parcubacteria bacterium]
MERKIKIFFFCAIFALALFFRFYKLKDLPPGLYPDVAIYANDAFYTLKTKNFKVFYEENNGREGLWMWILAIFFKIFGTNVFVIKASCAILGVLTVFGIYLLTKSLYEKEGLALFSSFLLAISFWHVNFSRIGFRVITWPLISSFAFYFLIEGLKTLKTKFFILAGIFFGLGFYTYTSFRLSVFVLPFLLFPFWQKYKKLNLTKKAFFSLFLFLLVTFFVALPIGIFFLKNPGYFFSRMAPISVFSGENKMKELLKSFSFHVLMFNFYGDPNLRHNIPQKSMLFLPVGILFLIGFFISCFKLKR